MVGVAFTYDESANKWDCIVTGVRNPTEARQAWYAATLTIKQLPLSLLNDAIVMPAPVEGAFWIIPAIIGG